MTFILINFAIIIALSISLVIFNLIRNKNLKYTINALLALLTSILIAFLYLEEWKKLESVGNENTFQILNYPYILILNILSYIMLILPFLKRNSIKVD
jgi:membrane protease YdiL (CAAX protease family)